MKSLTTGSVAVAFFWMALGTPAREVQSHGLMFEKWLRDTFFGGYQPESSTQKWDIPAVVNSHHGRIPVNPKAARYGSPVGLGDARRQFEIQEPFMLIVGFWQQEAKEQKCWVNVQTVTLAPERWAALWRPITHADLERLEAVIKDKKLSLEEARAQAQAIKSQPPFTQAIIQVNPKIDASQRRLQCSLRFADFFKHLVPHASPATQECPSVFGVPVPRSFKSAPRRFSPP